MPDRMTVADLLAALATLPSDHLVILARDGEGNTFSPLVECAETTYRPDSSWSGWISEDSHGTSRNAVVLWPVN